MTLGELADMLKALADAEQEQARMQAQVNNGTMHSDWTQRIDAKVEALRAQRIQ